MSATPSTYLGRLAPSPTGLLHLGHARTFWIAAQRAQAAGGHLLLRNDDLDGARCRAEYVHAFREDLAWLGIHWQEPMLTQSRRLPRYRAALARLHALGLVFPCEKSRRDVLDAVAAPHEDAPWRAGAASSGTVGASTPPTDDEPLYPRAFRPSTGTPTPPLPPPGEPVTTNWRFRVPDGLAVSFDDGASGRHTAVAGEDFGDFLVWRRDDVPSYQLACAVDDGELKITEVVRGADLVRSTFRQLLLLDALGLPAPRYYHAPLVTDPSGQRLAKRHDALAIRTLRAAGLTPADVLGKFSQSQS